MKSYVDEDEFDEKLSELIEIVEERARSKKPSGWDEDLDRAKVSLKGTVGL